MNNLEWILSLDEAKLTNEYVASFRKFKNATKASASGSMIDFLRWLASPHAEPIRLTPEERKAAELAVAIGLPWIKLLGNCAGISQSGDLGTSYSVSGMPNIAILKDANWLTSEPQDLRELLKGE